MVASVDSAARHKFIVGVDFGTTYVAVVTDSYT
jgi:hypothetical protein